MSLSLSLVLEFVDVSFSESHTKTLVFIRANTNVFTKTLFISSSTAVCMNFFSRVITTDQTLERQMNQPDL